MKNMTSKFRFFGFMFFLSFFGNSQDFNRFPDLKTKINIHKSGPYVGLQKGLFNVVELGGEYQWKKVKWVKPKTFSVNAGMNYNFQENVLGYDAGFWFKTGRLNLTYGAAICYRTDFTRGEIGFAPIIGFKLAQFHLQTGCIFFAAPMSYIKTNTFFISLRFVLINRRKFDFD